MPRTELLPDCALVIPNWNGARWLPRCLNAVRAQTLPAREIVVVDNGSQDDSLPLLARDFPEVKVIALARNTGFAFAVNTGIAATQSPLVALLNTDTVAEPRWLQSLAETLQAGPATLGAVTGLFCQLERPDRVENAGDILTWQGVAEKRGHGQPVTEYQTPGEIFSCCAGAALYRRSFLDDTGGFDPAFFAYWEDIDLGLRGRLLGYRYQFVPGARILHQGHGSGLPSQRYVRLSTANRWRVLLKNIPARLLGRHAFSLLYGQFYFLACQRRPIAAVAGGLDLLRALPAILRARKELSRRRRINPTDAEAWLAPRMQAPGLWRAFINRWRGQRT